MRMAMPSALASAPSSSGAVEAPVIRLIWKGWPWACTASMRRASSTGTALGYPEPVKPLMATVSPGWISAAAASAETTRSRRRALAMRSTDMTTRVAWGNSDYRPSSSVRGVLPSWNGFSRRGHPNPPVLFCSAACKVLSQPARWTCIPTWGREQSPLAVRCKRAFLLPVVQYEYAVSIIGSAGRWPATPVTFGRIIGSAGQRPALPGHRIRWAAAGVNGSIQSAHDPRPR